ncbi:MAG: NAD(P)/FAD-dependent oxidoreductase [Myxococcales bacterium]|nr:NAD(P)/FAD-dependent oxidoreductase [Candidatus Krumholzibacteria bacterium]MDH5305944.1 NAD(P)/FAD-dependent oxidoreductase [Myxococcales bacterium]MDH5566388.1 NAD(P)/FAD-dependent oxidoreductase [Myxococcales bacterium]
MANYDVIIIGAGHNGLVAAAYLAKAGRRVLVLERRSIVGGIAVTEEIFPGYKVSTVADSAGYLGDDVRRDLKLDSHVEIHQTDPIAFSPQPDGSHLTIWRDAARTAKEIERFSKSDAQAYPAFVELMRKIADVVGGLMRVTPPDLPDLSLKDLRGMLSLAGPVRRLGRKRINDLLRVLPMPATDLLDEWFESDALKGAISASSVRQATWGPQEAGTAYTLFHDWALSDTGLFRSSSFVKGGMGALSEAIAHAARGYGAEIRTDAAVAQIIVESRKAVGVTLANGEHLRCGVVVSNADPHTTFLALLAPRLLDASFVRHVRNIKYRGSAARIHLALRALPEFTALQGSDAVTHLRGPIQIAPSPEYIQRAFDCTKYGEYSKRPYLDISIPTLNDPSLAPSGQHLMSITAKYAPYALRNGDWTSQSKTFTEVALDTLAEYAPKIRECIAEQRTLTPLDLETTYALPEGNLHHGEMTLDQFFHMRPVPGYARYRTPVDGLYVCGSSTHPGGNVSGVPGRNAAHEILKDG